jgi:Methane oxygenase PmoA
MKIALLLLLFFMQQVLVAQPVYIKVNAKNFVRNKSIVTVALQKPLSTNAAYELVNVKSKSFAPVQQTDSNRIVFILPDVLQPGETATYLLRKSKLKKQTSLVTVEKQPTGLLVKVQGKKAFFYNTSLISPPGNLPAYYARSGFIHPLYSPAGNNVTDDFPVGHAHQHGIMMAWTSTEFKGHHHDFWNQQQQTASVKHIEVESITTGPVVTEIKLRLQQYSIKFGAVLNELWTITVYPFSNYFLFDLHSVQQNITTDTLYINKYHYGSIAFRGSRQWNDADSLHYKSRWNILTDSGNTLSNADGKRAAYVSASGAIDGKASGVTVFGFPANYNYPQPIRVHPSMPYWGFAPAVTNKFSINPGQLYNSAYRYFVHDGNPDTAAIKQLNNEISYPAEAVVSYGVGKKNKDYAKQ